MVGYGRGVVGGGEEECDEAEDDDEAAGGDTDDIEDECCVEEDVEGCDAVGDLGGPLDGCEIDVEVAFLEFVVEGLG